MFKNKKDFINQYRALCAAEVGREFEDCSRRDRYNVLARLIASKARSVRTQTMKRCRADEQKQIYYFSMEFLIGRLLENYLMNFGITDMVRAGLKDLGEDLDELYKEEADPGLGNGGLGRLAACFIDSLASLGYAGHGNGIRYRYGLFHQDIVDGRQVEMPDNWLENGYPWEIRKPENAVVVRFGGHVVRHEEHGKYWFTWEGGDPILAVPYDVPVVGYGGDTVNTLRLWSAEPYKENFDMDAYNRGDYSAAMKFRSDVEAITCVLYPDDKADPGKVLRLKQEYMFVAAGLENIIRSYKKEYGKDWKKFSKRVAIQTNDTHPSLCAPELMRIFIDEEGLDWDTAWKIVTKTISYTNHTILPEALEKWPIDMFRALLPRVYDFVEEIDRRYRESFPRDRENWYDLLRSTAILWDGQVRTANLSVIAGHAVNGVAALHTEILKENVLHGFYELTPEKFNNKTNGITHRRFLAQANPSYAKLITSAIGDGWYKNADELEGLLRYKDDASFLEGMERSKRENKERLARYIKETSGVKVDTSSIFDVQVKRFHAYKRQLLNVFKIMDLYNRLISDSSYEIEPTTFVFAGKAAQGYVFAKDVIRLVNSVANVINNDKRVNDKIKVAFVPNFSVSNAQYIYPASDISEQISTAGMEASGTGNMKFMMNGAITLGTLDGANVEIANLVGKDNIEIFGLRSEEVDRCRREHSYFSWDEYNADYRIRQIVDQLVNGTYAGLSGNFEGIYDTLMRANDEFFVLKDFKSYVSAWERLQELYADRDRWNRVSLHNTAKSGFFSSDRTIKQYAKDIWKL
ncbi:MAG: glycogen/starch/alpha-glucan phosphorylase [Oscillospiraceae bacterium]|nr:glycogen/starch/alpha-glucan phosphorylase [Oscillospiraceae bacterium]